MIEKFLPRTEFESYEDFKQNYKLIVPENFNFAYDIIDEWARQDKTKEALLWCNDEGGEKHFTFEDLRILSNKTANVYKSLGVKKGDKVMLILKQRPDAVLMLIGDGEDREMLRNTANELNIQDKVIFVGNTTSVQDYLSAMDVFVFPSLYEGLPLSILEVQANGLPCIISDTVPPDVFLTDLIHPLSLNDDKEKWVNEILAVNRSAKTDYPLQLKNAGFDIHTAMKKVYEIYEN